MRTLSALSESIFVSSEAIEKSDTAFHLFSIFFDKNKAFSGFLFASSEVIADSSDAFLLISEGNPISNTTEAASARIFSALFGSVFAISRAMEKRVSAFLSFSSISLAIDRALSGSVFAISEAIADNIDSFMK